MANHNVNISTTTEIPYITVVPASLTASQNDTVTFINSAYSSYSCSIELFDAGEWTNTATVNVSIGGSVVKTVSATATGSDALNLFHYHGGTKRNKAFTVTFAAAVDDTLDSITGQLGSDVTGYATSTVWYSGSNVATVSGISGTTASATLSGTMSNKQLRVNGGFWVTSATVSNGNTIEVQGTTGASEGTGYTIILTLTSGNAVSDTVTVTTASEPVGGTSLIPFNHATGSLPFSDIISFFAGATVSGIYTPPTDLGSFYRGGTTVPNITENNAIPTSGTIAFSNFRNAYTNMYFVDTPNSKSGIRNTISSGGQVVVAWYAFDTPWGTPADWQMGYSTYIKWAAEYQYSLTITSFVVNAGGYTVYPRLTAATPTTWTAASGWGTAGQVGFGVEMYVNQNSEIFCQGYVTMQVRHPQNTGYTLSVNVPFVLNAFGP